MKKMRMVSMMLALGLIVQSFGVVADAKVVDLSKREYVISGSTEDYYFNEGLAKICKGEDEPEDENSDVYGATTGGLYGFIDKKGNEVIKPEWDEVGDCREGLIPVRKKDDWFILDKKGKTVVELAGRYDHVYDYINGLAIVRKGDEGDGKYGFIDKKGNEIVGLKYDRVYPVEEGIAPVMKGNKWGIIDKKGKVIVKPKYDNIWKSSEGVSVFKKGNKWGLIDKKGKEMVKAKFDALYDCCEGFCVYRKGNEETGKYGFIDKKGNIIVKAKYNGVFGFKDGLATVFTEKGAGAINKKGKLVIKDKYEYMRDFHEGRAAFKNQDGLMGFIDKKGKEEIKGKFEEVADFNEGLAFVLGEKVGYIDKSGKWAIIIR